MGDQLNEGIRRLFNQPLVGESGGNGAGGAPPSGTTVDPVTGEPTSAFPGVESAVSGQQDLIDQSILDLQGFGGQLGGLGGQLGGIAGQFGDIAAGNDPRFGAFRTAQLDLLESQRSQQTGALQNQFARTGLGDSSAASNQVNALNQQFNLQGRGLSSQIGLQQLGRQDQALGAQAGLVGQQAGIVGQQAGLTAGAVDLGQTGVQNTLAIPTLGIAGQAAQNAGLGGGGKKVICTELYRRGDMPFTIYEADTRYHQTVGGDVISGYHMWGKPLAGLMRRKEWVYSIVRPFALCWAEHTAYKMGAVGIPNRRGQVLAWIGESLCYVIGKTIRYRQAGKAMA